MDDDKKEKRNSWVQGRKSSKSPDGSKDPSPRSPDKSPRSPKAGNRLSMLLSRRSSIDLTNKNSSSADSAAPPKARSSRSSVNIDSMIIAPSAPALQLRKMKRDSMTEQLSEIEQRLDEDDEYELSDEAAARLASSSGNVTASKPVFDYDFSETVDDGDAKNVRGRSPTQGSMLPIYRLSHGGMFPPNKLGDNVHFAALLESIFEPHNIVEFPGRESGKHWVVAAEANYFIYISLSSESIHCSLLLEDVARSTADAQKQVGEKLEIGMRVLQMALGMVKSPPRSPRAAVSPGSHRSMSPTRKSPPSPSSSPSLTEVRTLERQMHELRDILAQHAAKTEAKLETIHSAIIEK